MFWIAYDFFLSNINKRNAYAQTWWSEDRSWFEELIFMMQNLDIYRIEHLQRLNFYVTTKICCALKVWLPLGIIFTNNQLEIHYNYDLIKIFENTFIFTSRGKQYMNYIFNIYNCVPTSNLSQILNGTIHRMVLQIKAYLLGLCGWI